MIIANNPNEMGPEVFTFVICLKVLSSPLFFMLRITRSLRMKVGGDSNPMYVPKKLACEFVEEMAEKFVMGEREEEGETEVERPDWLTKEKLGNVLLWYSSIIMIKF